MYRISMNDVLEVIDEFKVLDTCLVRNIDRIVETVECCKKIGFETQSRQLEKIVDELIKKRYTLYELVTALNKINEIYKKNEKYLLENMEACQKKKIRNAEWINIIFSRKIMKIINKIRV